MAYYFLQATCCRSVLNKAAASSYNNDAEFGSPIEDLLEVTGRQCSRRGSGQSLVGSGPRSARTFELTWPSPYRRRQSSTPVNHAMLAISSTNPAFCRTNDTMDSLVSAHSFASTVATVS